MLKELIPNIECKKSAMMMLVNARHTRFNNMFNFMKTNFRNSKTELKRVKSERILQFHGLLSSHGALFNRINSMEIILIQTGF